MISDMVTAFYVMLGMSARSYCQVVVWGFAMVRCVVWYFGIVCQGGVVRYDFFSWLLVMY